MNGNNGNRVAIAGGGLAGLAAAAYLGREGYRVTVFERSETFGGRASTDERSGYRHNRGPHALYRGGAGESVLKELGIAYTGRTPDVAGVAVRGGRAHTLPTSAKTMLTTRLFGVRARVEAGKQLLALRKPHPEDRRTVREWLDQEFHQPAAREYVEAIIRLATYSNAPGVIPLHDAARQMAGVGAGVLYLDGGWQTLVDGLRSAALAAGAEVRSGARVDRVTHAQSGWRVTFGDGSAFEADAVVLAVPPAAARDISGNHPQLANLADAAVPAYAACLDIGLTRLPNPRRRFGLGIDVPYYMSVHSYFAKLAPEGRVLLSVAKYIPNGGKPDGARDLAELEAFLDVAQPGWRAFEEHRQYLPNMVVQSSLPTVGHGLARRPSPTVAGAEGLFIAGDWVGDGGWLADGTLGSARQAAAAVGRWLEIETASPALAVASVA